jgi:hypothetical protein
VAKPGKDYMQTMASYVKVQRGLAQGDVTYVDASGCDVHAPGIPARRFILKTAVEAHRVPFSGREIHGSGAAIRLRRRGQRDRSV